MAMTLKELIEQTTSMKDTGLPLDTKIVRADNSIFGGYEDVYRMQVLTVTELGSTDTTQVIV